MHHISHIPNHAVVQEGIFSWAQYQFSGQSIKLNGTIHSLCKILKFVAASAAEAELGALFLIAKEAKTMCITLEELGHSQPPTSIHIDNTCIVGIVNNTIKPQRSFSMEIW